MDPSLEYQYPLKIERDNAVVSLSKTIAEIRSAQQTKTISIRHLNDFKEYFTRVLNFTIADSRLKDAKFKSSSLIIVAGNVRNTKTTIENIDYQIKIAGAYIESLFSSGVLSI